MSNNPIFTTSFFKSLTNPFSFQHSTTNADRLKFDLSTITSDLFQQELLNKLRSGSTQSRQNILDTEIIYTLSNFEPAVIPDVWYLAKDLISPNVSSNQVKRSALNLLFQCINIPNQESTAFYIYFNDVLTNVISSKDKVDTNLDLILKCLKVLTDDGRFVHHYQEPFKEPLLDFFLETLWKTNDLLKQKLLVPEFLDFVIESVKSGILDSDSTNEDETITNLVNSVIKMASKTSDRLILEKCLNLIDTIVIYKFIPESLLYNVLEVLSGSSVLDLNYYDISTETVLHIIEPNQKIDIVLKTLNDVLLCKNPKSTNDKNINASIGSLKIIKFLSPLFPYKVSFDKVFQAFNEVLNWNKSALNLAILQFLQDFLSDPSLFSQINQLQIWDLNLEDPEKVSILVLLENISSKLNNDSESTQQFRSILVTLHKLQDSSQYPGSLQDLVEFFIKLPSYLSMNNCLSIISFYKFENLCSPLNPNWENNIQKLLDVFYLDNSKELNVKISTLRLIKDVFDSSLNTIDDANEETLLKITTLLFKNFKLEDNTDILNLLGEYLVDVSLSVSGALFDKILTACVRTGFGLVSSDSKSERRASLPTLLLSNNSYDNSSKSFSQKTMKVLLRSYVKIFALSLQTDGLKCSKTYDFLIKVAQLSISKKNVDLLLIISRLLVRVRATIENQIYLTNPTDMDGLSAAFARNLKMRKIENNSPFTAASTSSSSNQNVELKPTGSLEEKWTYPEEIDYIPDETLDKPSPFLYVYHDELANQILFNKKEKSVIYIDQWLTVVISILEQCPHWEIYSFIYTHFCPQLSNLKLFESVNCTEGIKKFRSLVCDQLMLKLPTNLKIPTITSSSASNLNPVSQAAAAASNNNSTSSSGTSEQITKHDLQVAIIRNFTPLISYHELFSKQEQDQIISALLVGLSSSWEKTAVPCVHILTICCYEIPLSIIKFLNVLLTKLQTRISSPYAAAHILEFLSVLSYQPQLTSNFTVDEFKRAFGICFKFIQYAHDIKLVKENSHHGVLNHGKELEAEIRPSTEFLEMSPVISTYLLNLAYDVIANWFLNMNMKDRRKLSSFIIKSLITSQSNHGKDSINIQNLSFIDLITRFTYSDLELKFNKIKTSEEHFRDRGTENILSSKWIFGNGIISIDTHSITGESLVSIRRASGSSVFVITPDESMVPYYTDQLHNRSGEEDPEDDDVFSENYILLQLIVQLDQNDRSKPIPIPKESSFTRSLGNIDRIPVVEFHKVGLLYIGPGQKTETEILMNEKGSKSYDQFLNKVGRMIKLKECKSFYVGGLDTENDADGEYALGWNDKILQIVFHATTMMPAQNQSSASIDQQLSFKKRHIGNNHVNIFFDESGLAFDFNTIKSQFNFLNIVIQPHSISSKPENGLGNEQIRKFKVKIYRRSGVPALFAACHFKILTEENLPIFIRTIAILANQFAQIWHSNNNYESSWSYRMKSILNIKEKSIRFQTDLKTKQKLANANSDNEEKKQAGSGQSFLDQLNSENNSNNNAPNEGGSSSNSGLGRSTSISRAKNTNSYEIFDDEENDFFKNLEFTSFTK